MITEKQMTTLLDIKDAVDALDGVVEILLGRSEAIMFSEGALGQLTKIYGLIREFSTIDVPLSSPEDDVSQSPVVQIMDDKTMSNEEKARKLLGSS